MSYAHIRDRYDFFFLRLLIIGPAEKLFQETYFKLMKTALKAGGIICAQASFIWQKDVTPLGSYNNAKKVFGNAAVGYVVVPNYPTGQISMVLASTDPVRLKTNDERIIKNKKLHAEAKKIFDYNYAIRAMRRAFKGLNFKYSA